jgi:tetratricopeptide (TPR) repeat protein
VARYFISYSRRDGSGFPLRLHAALLKGTDVEPWIDVRNDPQQKESVPGVIAQSEGFVLALPIGDADALCRREVQLAEEYHKPLIQVRADPKAEPLERAWNWPLVEFGDELEPGLTELLRLIGHQQYSARDRSVIVDALTRAERDYRSASTAAERARMGQYVNELQQKLEALSHQDGQGHSWRQGRIQDLAVVPATTGQRIRFIHDLPDVPPDPSQFQDRAAQTELLDEQLRTPQVRAIVVVGPAGFGKTSMVVRYLRQLEADPQAAPLDAVLYLSAHGTQPVNPAVLLDGLRQIAHHGATDHEMLLLRSDLTALQKLEGLLPDLVGVRACVVIDSLEELLDPMTQFADPQLDDLVGRLLSTDQDEITLILVSRTWPEKVLVGLQGDGEVQRLPLGHGLPRKDVRTLLQRLDAHATLGLARMEDDAFEQLYERTGGHPRALEALFAILRDNPRMMPRELLDRVAGLRHDAVVDFLVGEMFDHLFPADQRVLQALAVFGRPVRPDAVDALLRPYAPHQQSETMLQRLVALRIARRDGPGYYLSRPDRDLAFDRIPDGLPSDRDRDPPPYTKLSLLHRAADQLVLSRVPEPKRVSDLTPILAEIELRIRGKEFITAFELIEEIDDSFLSRWGHTDLVAAPRGDLVGKLHDPERELSNFAALGEIELDRGEPADAADHYRGAIAVAKRLDRPTVVAALRVNLGTALYASGQLAEAIREYEDALSVADEHLSPREQAHALSGLAACHAEAGQFEQALSRGERSLDIARSNGLSGLEAEVLMNTGRWYGELGDTLTAMERLEAARTLARQPLVVGMCLDATAEILIDQGRIRRAIQAAEEAIAIGEEIRSSQLVREASTTLSLAELCAGCPDGLQRARVRLDMVCRHRKPGHTLNALVLRGIMALRRGDTETAEKVFDKAWGEARSLGNLESRRFNVRNVEGLAQCGLALCNQGDPGALEDASRAFSSAKAVTIASGVMIRVMRLLDELEAGGTPGFLAGPRGAASDRTLPQVAAD